MNGTKWQMKLPVHIDVVSNFQLWLSRSPYGPGENDVALRVPKPRILLVCFPMFSICEDGSI